MLSATPSNPSSIGQHRRRFLILGLLAVLGISLLLALYGIWFYNKTNQLVTEYKVRSSEAMAQSLAIAVMPDLITRDYGAIESDLRLIMANQEVVSALALDDSGKLLAHFMRKTGQNTLVPSYIDPNISPPGSAVYTTEEDTLIETWSEVGEPVRLGWIQLKIDTAGNEVLLEDLHRQTTLIFTLSALGFIALFAGGIFLTFHKVETSERSLTQQNQALTIAALLDPLTALPNRLLLVDRLSVALASHDRSQGLLVVCFVDLDGFKSINDRFGHEAGDIVLKVTSERLLKGVREHDTVARLGGDEFVLLINNIDHAQQVSEILQRLLAQLRQPIVYLEQELTIGASIGYTIYPEDSSDPDHLIEHADSAMYAAKRAGKNQVCRFADLSAG